MSIVKLFSREWITIDETNIKLRYYFNDFVNNNFLTSLNKNSEEFENVTFQYLVQFDMSNLILDIKEFKIEDNETANKIDEIIINYFNEGLENKNKEKLNDVDNNNKIEEKDYFIENSIMEAKNNNLIDFLLNPSPNNTICQIKQNTIKSSYDLGVIGEEQVYNSICEWFDEFENIVVSKSPYLCDIHSIDRNNNILYAYEIKNKSTITIDDLRKFERDLNNIQEQNISLKVIGLFISLNSNIPRHGKFDITKTKCYITKSYFTKEILQIIEKTYKEVLTQISENENNGKIEYIVPENVYKLLTNLKCNYQDLIDSKKIIEDQINFNSKSNENMEKLRLKMNAQIELINFINKEFVDTKILDNETVENIKIEDEKTKLTNYLNTTSPSRVTKKTLIEMCPLLKSELVTMTMNKIFEKYKTVEKKIKAKKE